MHEAGEAEEPGRWEEVGTADDALGHEELCTVDNEPGDVTEEKHNDNADKDAGKIYLIVGTAVVTVRAVIRIPGTKMSGINLLLLKDLLKIKTRITNVWWVIAPTSSIHNSYPVFLQEPNCSTLKRFRNSDYH